MPLPKGISLETRTFYIDKTGVPFFDAARLIGAAHLFFGTASAEIEDKGAYWEVRGIKNISRDEDQIKWILEAGKQKAWDLQQKSQELERAMKEAINSINIRSKGLPQPKGYAALKEFDAALQYSPRGPDPLKSWVTISSQGTKPESKEKQYLLSGEDLIFASIGFSFSALSKSSGMRTFILPVFRERVVVSGFLKFRREFSHSAGHLPAVILSAITILLDLVAQRIPVVDFVYTSIFGRNVFSSSGYLGLERLCSVWWQAVKEEKEIQRTTLSDALRQIRAFLSETSSQNTHERVKDLARYVAAFAANPNIEALTMIQRLKARILAAQEDQKQDKGTYAVYRLFDRSEIIKEVGAMTISNLPTAPWQVTEAVASALSLDEKGWMNQFTRLENATSFSNFITQLEHTISRGIYREQQEKKKEIWEAIRKAKDLSAQLKEMASQLSDEKTFRAFKAVFLLDVLSKMRRPSKEGSGVEKTIEEGGA